MLKVVAGLAGAALLLNVNVNVASAAKREFLQTRGLNALAGANGESADACVSWSVSAALSEALTKSEPGASEITNSALVSFFATDQCNNSLTIVNAQIPDVAKFKGNLTGASLAINVPVTVTNCSFTADEFTCVDSTSQLSATLDWSSTGSPVRSRQHINNLAPDGVRSSIRVEGTTRDSITTGSVSIQGQTYALTADNASVSSLTSDAHMFVVLTAK